MKKLILLTALLLHTACSLFAQHKGLSLGIGAGPSITGFHGTAYGYYLDCPHIEYVQPRLLARYGLSEHLSVVSGFAYERTGRYGYLSITDTLTAGTMSDITMNRQFNYLSMPLLLRLSSKGKISYFVNAGGYGAWLVSAHYTSLRLSPGTIEVYDANVTGYFKRWDAGFVLGVGSAVEITQHLSIYLEFRGSTSTYNRMKSGQLISGWEKSRYGTGILSLVYHFGGAEKPSQTKQ